MNIKNKLIAISAALALMMSFSGCSDSGSDPKDGDNDSAVEVSQGDTLSSEEAASIAKYDLTITPYNPGSGDVQQDPVEGGDSASADAQAGSDDAAGADSAQGGNNAAGGSDPAQQGGGNINGEGNNDQSAQQGGNEGGNAGNADSNNDPQPGGQTKSDIGNNNADLPKDTGLQVISGTKSVMQAFWMDMSKQTDYVFNGEYLTAQFKIKDGAQNGIYPITIDWMDTSNWEAQKVNFTCIDGAVVVGGEAKENTFNDASDPQILVSNVSGNAGDTVTVSFNIKNNPGLVANILRFGYNSDALEYVGGGSGADFNGKFQ